MQRNVITCISELVVKMMTFYAKAARRKFLGVMIDNELKFDPHIRSMCKKAA